MARTLLEKGTGKEVRDGVAALILIADSLDTIHTTLAAMLAIMKEVHEKGVDK